MRMATILLGLCLALGAAATTGAQSRDREVARIRERILRDFDKRLDRELDRLRRALKREIRRAVDQEIRRLLPARRAAVAPPRAVEAKPPAPARPARKQPGWLGVYLAELNSVSRKVAGIERGGLLVQSTVKGSPAEKAGLKAHDVLIKINDRPILELESVVKEIRGLGAGAKVNLLVARDGVQKYIEVRLGERPKTLAPGPAPRPVPKPKAPPRRQPKPQPKPQPQKPAWLGVILGEDFEDRDRPEREPLGVEIDEVAAGGPAARAGLRAGDIILRVGTRAINRFVDLRRRIERARAGQRVAIQVRRGRRTMTLNVVLGVRGGGRGGGASASVPKRPSVFRQLRKADGGRSGAPEVR